MKFIIIVKASKASEAGEMPSTELLTAIGNYNEELSQAGILLAGEGLHPSSKGGLLAVGGRLAAAGDRLGEALPQPA